MLHGQQFHPGYQSNKSSNADLVMPHHADIFPRELPVQQEAACVQKFLILIYIHKHVTYVCTDNFYLSVLTIYVLSFRVVLRRLISAFFLEKQM